MIISRSVLLRMINVADKCFRENPKVLEKIQKFERKSKNFRENPKVLEKIQRF